MVERRGKDSSQSARRKDVSQREVVNPILEDEFDDFDHEYIEASSRSNIVHTSESGVSSLPSLPVAVALPEHPAPVSPVENVSEYHQEMYEDYDVEETLSIEAVAQNGAVKPVSHEYDEFHGEEAYVEAQDELMEDSVAEIALPMVDLDDDADPGIASQPSDEFVAMYHLPDMSAEDYEEEVAFENPWDATDDIVTALEQAVAERADELGVHEQENASDDRDAVLQALLSSDGMSDTDDEDSEYADSDDGLLDSIHENSPFAAVDDEGIPDWFSLDRVLSDAIDQDVSDVYIVPDQYIHFKKFGLIFEQKEYGFILPELTERLYMAIITNVEESEFVEERELDASYVMRSGRHTGRRFRMSLGNTFGAQYLNFRIIVSEVPSPDDLKVPETLQNWAKLSRGIFMVNGPTGSGKSTTIASLIRQIQLREQKTIITIERPIEFEYPKDGKSLVIQRNVGSDTHSFSNGLKTSLRNAPDIIVVGEVRDREEVDELLRAAETGHLAISTMHTETCAGTISRMTGLYSGSDRNRVTDVLSTVGRGFANQLLLRKPDGSGRTAIHEILEVDEEVAALIAKNDIAGIIAYQNKHKASMDHELARAYVQKHCTLDDARSLASNPATLDRILRTEDF